MDVRHYDGPNFTPAYALALRGHADLTANGLGPESTVISWDQQVIFAEVDGTAAGVILWTYQEPIKEVFIWLGYVAPEHRGKGVYRALWGALVEKAREEGADHINGITSLRNAPMRAAAARLGRVEEGVVLTFRL